MIWKGIFFVQLVGLFIMTLIMAEVQIDSKRYGSGVFWTVMALFAGGAVLIAISRF